LEGIERLNGVDNHGLRGELSTQMCSKSPHEHGSSGRRVHYPGKTVVDGTGPGEGCGVLWRVDWRRWKGIMGGKGIKAKKSVSN